MLLQNTFFRFKLNNYTQSISIQNLSRILSVKSHLSLFLLSKFTEEKVQISFGSNQICYKDLQIDEERNIDYNLFFLYSYIKHYSTNVDKAWSTISIFGSIIPIIDY